MAGGNKGSAYPFKDADYLTIPVASDGGDIYRGALVMLNEAEANAIATHTTGGDSGIFLGVAEQEWNTADEDSDGTILVKRTGRILIDAVYDTSDGSLLDVETATTGNALIGRPCFLKTCQSDTADEVVVVQNNADSMTTTDGGVGEIGCLVGHMAAPGNEAGKIWMDIEPGCYNNLGYTSSQAAGLTTGIADA